MDDRSELPAAWAAACEATSAAALAQLADAWRLSDSDPARAAASAEALFPQLATQPDLAPWLALIVITSGRINSLSTFGGLDPCLDFCERQRSQLQAPPELTLQIDACYFGGLVFRRPGHPRMAHWAQRCQEAVNAEGEILARLNAANFLLLYRIWRGDLLGADALRAQVAGLREQTDDPRARLLSHSLSSMSRRLFLDYDGCTEEIAQGLALAKRCDAHFLDSHFYMQGTFLALCRENLEEAEEWLGKMEPAAPPEHLLDRSGYHYGRGWLHLLQGRGAHALTHTRESVALAEASGAVFPQAITHMALGQLYLEQQQPARALYHIARARRRGREMGGSHGVPFIRGLAQAHVAFRLGLHRRGRRALTQALAIGREQRYVNYPWWRSGFMANLCARALEADIEPDYVRTLIRQRRLQPPADLQCPQAWHWALSINVLGAPAILRDGERLELSSKASEVLLALACLGDGDHWVDRGHLIDLLWPDSDGDRAQRALDTAIHRLRRQLRSEALILTRPGVVTLNPGLCQVDYWWFLRCLNQPGSAGVDRLVDDLARLASAGEHRRLLPVNQLQRRVVRKVLDLIGRRQHDPAEAERWLENLLEIVPEHERLWQALIRNYLDQGLVSAAVEAWHRCEAALAANPGTAPAPATQALVGKWLRPPARASR